MYEDGPTGSIEALLTVLAGGVIGSISICGVLQEGMFTTMRAINNCKETWGMRREVRRDQREMNSDGDIA